MHVRDLLAIAVVDLDPVVIFDTESPGNHLDHFNHIRKNLRRGVLQIRVLVPGDNQQMDCILGAVVGNDNQIGVLMEYPGLQFAIHNPGEN